MTEDRRPRPRPGRSPSRRTKQFVTQKQATPTWIVVAFIGVPCLVILVLAGLLVKNLVAGGPDEEPEVLDANQNVKEADAFFREAQDLIAKGKQLSTEGKPGSERLFRQALDKLTKARKLYQAIIDEAKEQEGADYNEEEYDGYVDKITEIQKLIGDAVKMIPLMG